MTASSIKVHPVVSFFSVLLCFLQQTLLYAYAPWGGASSTLASLTTARRRTLSYSFSHQQPRQRQHYHYYYDYYSYLSATKDSEDSSSLQDATTTAVSCDVAIFGGGFGGLYTALAMSRQASFRKQNLDICLVEPTDSFVFLPLLYDLTVGTATEAEVCPLYEDLLQNSGIRHVKASLETFSSSINNSETLAANNNNNKNCNNPQIRKTTMMTARLKPSLSSSSKNSSTTTPTTISFAASVIAVGASPESILAKTPGALKYAQPFYTAKDAQQTRKLLARFEHESSSSQRRSSSSSLPRRRPRPPHPPRIAIVGGGFGGVELAASVQRKLKNHHHGAQVTLLSRGPPMAGTRAEPLIHKALRRLGVTVQECSVEALEEYQEAAVGADSAESDSSAPTSLYPPRVIVKRKPWKSNDNGDSDEEILDDSEPWDAVLWTAGSGPASPVGEGHGLDELRKSDSGRLATDSTLRCFACEKVEMTTTTGSESDKDDGRKVKRVFLKQPPVWALGDCAEIVSINNNNNNNQPAVPKTAQAAMQQADVVAYNVLAQLETSNGKRAPCKQFQYQDLGSMLMLGGPNAALMAPRDGSLLAPIFTPALDTATAALGFADKILEATVGKSPIVDKFGLSPETLGLSLGSYGLGVEAGVAPGTLAGTLTGAARRAVYAARMPTNRQRAVAATSAAIFTAAALVQEAATRNQQSNQ